VVLQKGREIPAKFGAENWPPNGFHEFIYQGQPLPTNVHVTSIFNKLNNMDL